MVARNSPYSYNVGDQQRFALLNLDTPRIVTISATLRRITDHAYFFVEDGSPYTEEALSQIGSDFESLVYPTVHNRFGTEWTPGVDSDPRITVLHANLSGAGGYFSADDEYPVVIVPNSNEREMVYLDAGALGSPGPAYNALLAHELQHLVHWHADPGEESWVNEGLSQVSAEELGGGSDWLSSFLAQPDTQLNYWPPLSESGIHYAASELFCSYLLDHYGGRERAKELLAEQGDGIAGINEYLAQFGTDFGRVFADWVVANYLDTADGAYSHKQVDARTRTVTTVTREGGQDTVSQLGADYLDTGGLPAGSVLKFDGADDVSLGIPDPGGPYWWSERGDGIDSKLTREFDLSGVQRATLRFRTWFDTERGWDYAYIAASTDGGMTWKALPGKQTTEYNPVEAAYGPGYSGNSSGWVQEEVDLGPFSGRKLLLRFEYVTDDSTSLTGLAVRDVQVPEIGFSDSTGSDAGWQAEGFERINGPLHQQFIVQKIEGKTVTQVPLDGANRADIPIDGGAIIVVSGVTDETAEKAAYKWSVVSP